MTILLYLVGFPAARINGVPFLFVLSGRRVANHVLVFLICALSKLRVFVCSKACFALYALWCFYIAHFI